MFLQCLSLLFAEAFVRSIPLRIGVALDPLFADASRSIVVGTPMVQAYLLEEAQNWCGGAVHSSVPGTIVGGDGGAVVYPVPLKANYVDTCLALDWPFHAGFRNRDIQLAPELGSRVEQALDGYLAQDYPPDVHAKFLNTANYWASRRRDFDAS